jgi:hypothetical protein
LISSTLLTLLVLPVLYGFFRKTPETRIPESELEVAAGETCPTG